MNILYLNPSSDKIQCVLGNKKLVLEHKSLEITLPKLLVQWYREEGFEQAIIINGPGGFTNLRISCLVLNMLQALTDGKLRFFDLTKIQCYSYAYQQKILPRRGCIHIGQKSNQRLYDFEKWTYEMIKKTDEIDQEYFHDQLFDAQHLSQLELFFEDNILMLKYQHHNLNIPYKELTAPLEHLEPHYMIEPTITLKSVEKTT